MIKTSLIQLVKGFIFINGTVGITMLQQQSANLIPFISFGLLGVNLFLIVLLMMVQVAVDRASDRQKLEDLQEILNNHTRNPKTFRYISNIFSFLLIFLIAAYGFFWSGLAMLGAWFVGLIGRLILDTVKESVDNTLKVMEAYEESTE